ncbi:MAG: DHH family phosphoesterase [Gammaproteobacteria bacterium]|nr:DHH family phosphoesterase [Gammaproteobacteria bacterium]
MNEVIRIVQRSVERPIEKKLIDSGYHPLLARIVAGRPLINDRDPEEFIFATAKSLDHPDSLFDINRAADRIVQAILDREVIAQVADYDADGNGVMSVTLVAMTEYFGVSPELLSPYIGDRLTEGYGLSEGVCKRILASDSLPGLVITGDCGSSDEPRIKKLKDAGIDVIVTDHHAFPVDGPPESAYAVVSPVHPDGEFPDPTIAGGYVTWLLMATVRRKLIEQDIIPEDSPNLGRLLDFCAISTVADCVSLASTNNRVVVKNGLTLINNRTRPAWEVFTDFKNSTDLLSSDIAFTLGPMLNSAGRLSDAFESVSFLVTRTNTEARKQMEYLRIENERRKEVERETTKLAKDFARKSLNEDSKSIVVDLPEGHPGVIGIVASRLKESFGLPSVVLAPSGRENGLITGSVRGIDYTSFHCRDALQHVAEKFPEMLVAFGGHSGAAGLTLKAGDIEAFTKSFEGACGDQLADKTLGPVIITDGRVDSFKLDLELLDTLAVLEPFGRGFEKPVFEIEGKVVDLRIIGESRTHLKILLKLEGQNDALDSVWFNFREHEYDPVPVSTGDIVRCAGTLEVNVWKERRTAQIIIRSCSASRNL